MQEKILAWLDQALEDFDTAKSLMKLKKYSDAAFYCQQSIEKALKALYIKKFGVLKKTHDLYYLGEKLKIPKQLLEICDEISSFYVETRYPDSYAEFTEDDVMKAIENVERVIEWVKKKI